MHQDPFLVTLRHPAPPSTLTPQTSPSLAGPLEIERPSQVDVVQHGARIDDLVVVVGGDDGWLVVMMVGGGWW